MTDRPATRFDPRDADPLYTDEEMYATYVMGWEHGSEDARFDRRRYGYLALAAVIVILAALAVGLLLVPSVRAAVHSEGAGTAIGEPLVGLPDTATSVRGVASWFCLPGRSRCTSGAPSEGAYAAAGPALRVGDWRGRIVKVCVTGTTRCVRVALRDFCACPRRVVDLYASQFRRLAPLSRGTVRVEVSWGGDAVPLPPTSTVE